MINGYEYLYTAEEGKEPKYELHIAKDEDFAHDIDGSGNRNHLGVTSCEAMTNLIEQNVGKKFYKDMLRILSDYRVFYNLIVEYQEDKAKFDILKTSLEESKKNESVLIEQKKDIEKQIKDVIDSNDEDKSSKVKELNEQLRLKEEEISTLKGTNSISDKLLVKAEKKLNKNYAEIKKLKTALEKAANNLDMKKLEEVKKKFNNPEFQKQIEQEFVDTMLLPGEEKKENDARHTAQTWFTLFKNEAKYLTSLKPVIQNLVSNIDVQLTEEPSDIKLNTDVQAQHSVIIGMGYLTTDIVENSMGRFDSKNYREFYIYTMQLVKDSEYGKYPSFELANVPAVAMKKFGFKQSIDKKASQDLTSANEIFNGITNLIEGQAILLEQVNLDNNL